jgi:dTDP-glucose 4,6-dehydratase
MIFLVAGGAGFIGSHFADLLVAKGHRTVVVDSLTYAGTASNVPAGAQFVRRDINDRPFVRNMLADLRPDAIFNFAAESHVCRSIAEPQSFIDSNIVGTYSLLQEAKRYWEEGKPNFRFVQISTDEVFGDLGPAEAPFSAGSPYSPHSPYSASKAAADHLVRAWGHTYGLPTLVTHCSNNYGSRQHPEKLIPRVISRLKAGKEIILHGDGSNVRDWIHVSDHCAGIWSAYLNGEAGMSYCFGGEAERTNLQIATEIVDYLGVPRKLITFGPDRPGNDRRYAIDNTLAKRLLSWQPTWDFEDGLRDTINHYINVIL